mgnify:CR=1 FL=1
MGITKLIRRSVGIMSLSLLIILLANLTLLTVFALRSTAGGHPWTMAAETASALQRTDSGYALDAGQAQALESEGAWAVLVDTGTLSVSWHTENAPAAALEQYTAAGIAMLTRGYIDDCPTFTASTENGDLVVVGFPDGSYWKHMYPSWDYDLIANAPLLFFILLAFNLLLVMGIYVAANSRLYKSVRPIEEGVEALPTLMGTPVRERGLLAPLAQSINRTAEILRSQRAELRRKDMARSEWISGVSHDIRTPLVMVMGLPAGGQYGPARGGAAQGGDHPAPERAHPRPGRRPQPRQQAGVQHAAAERARGQPGIRGPGRGGGVRGCGRRRPLAAGLGYPGGCGRLHGAGRRGAAAPRRDQRANKLPQAQPGGVPRVPDRLRARRDLRRDRA